MNLFTWDGIHSLNPIKSCHCQLKKQMSKMRKTYASQAEHRKHKYIWIALLDHTRPILIQHVMLLFGLLASRR